MELFYNIFQRIILVNYDKLPSSCERIQPTFEATQHQWFHPRWCMMFLAHSCAVHYCYSSWIYGTRFGDFGFEICKRPSTFLDVKIIFNLF